MSQTNVNNLHHPRPTVARSSTTNGSGSLVTRPSIQYPITPVPRPAAPAPSTPEVRRQDSYSTTPTTHNSHGGWANDASSSPTLTRRSGKSSETAYVGEHMMQYSDLSRTNLQGAAQPAILRQRSASSPEHHRGHGAYGAEVIVGVGKPRVVRQNTAGNVHFTPDNLFISITSSHSLKIYNLTPSNNGPNAIMDNVRGHVLSPWTAGIKRDNEARGEWTVRLNRNVWTARGAAGVTARRMVLTLFSLLAIHGYSYLCSIQNTSFHGSPRHLFTSSPPIASRFFGLAFSLHKRKLSFIDAPSDINVAVSNALKNAAMFDVDEIDEPDTANERQEDSQETEDDEDVRRVYTYRLARRAKVPRGKDDVQLFLTRNEKADMLMLLSQLLKIIATYGYRLDASVSLGPVGPLGLRGRREMWIFKSVSWKVDKGDV